MQMGFGKSLFDRIDRICTKNAIEDEECVFNKTFMENDYPLKFINQWKERPTINFGTINHCLHHHSIQLTGEPSPISVNVKIQSTFFYCLR